MRKEVEKKPRRILKETDYVCLLKETDYILYLGWPGQRWGAWILFE